MGFLSDMVRENRFTPGEIQGVGFVASTGLRVIRATCRRLAAAGGKLVVCGLNHTVQEVLGMSGFSQMFAVLETEAKALATS